MRPTHSTGAHHPMQENSVVAALSIIPLPWASL
jgi:hypothetical protein